MTRKRDLSFEALAEVTSTDWTVGRGKLNEALSGIRTQMPDADDAELATEIVYRAKLYRQMMPEVILTPQALNQHWLRVAAEQKRPSAGATNLSTHTTDCQTCGGNRFVVFQTRPVETTQWMTDHGFKGSGEIEEWAPCPDCSSEIDCSYRGHDGRMVRPPDPASVRARIS